MVLRKLLDQYVSSYQRCSKSVIRLGNNEVLKTLTKTLTFVDADANAASDAGGSTIALCERCSGELKSIDPDKTPRFAASDQGLYCLPLMQQILDTSTGNEKKLVFLDSCR